MAENITAIIEVKSIEPKSYPENTDYVFKDQVGRVFHVYKFKKNTQEESTAYKQMVNMGLRTDLAADKQVTVEVWYAEVENKHGGTTRYIASFKEAGNNPVSAVGPSQTAPQGQSSNGEANRGQSGAFKDEAFWDMKAYKQCLWGQALKVGLENFGSKDCDLVWNTFKSIEMDAERRFKKLTNVIEPGEVRLYDDKGIALPTIQINEDLNVEGIPF